MVRSCGLFSSSRLGWMEDEKAWGFLLRFSSLYWTIEHLEVGDPPMTAYTDQLKRGLKCGWSHADADSMLAALCQILATRNALQPEAVYEWAIAQGHDYKMLRDHAASRSIPDWSLVEAVLNNEPMEAVP